MCSIVKMWVVGCLVVAVVSHILLVAQLFTSAVRRNAVIGCTVIRLYACVRLVWYCILCVGFVACWRWSRRGITWSHWCAAKSFLAFAFACHTHIHIYKYIYIRIDISVSQASTIAGIACATSTIDMACCCYCCCYCCRSSQICHWQPSHRRKSQLPLSYCLLYALRVARSATAGIFLAALRRCGRTIVRSAAAAAAAS